MTNATNVTLKEDMVIVVLAGMLKNTIGAIK